jgi:predicted transcriptional regulator
MKKLIEMQTFKELLQPSLVDILLLLNEQARTETHLAILLKMNTVDVQNALEILIKQGLVRPRENESIEYIYEITPEGRQIFDLKGYRTIILLGISAFIFYSLGLGIVINCFSSPIYDVSFIMPLQDEMITQQFIIGGFLTFLGITVAITALYKLIRD